MHPSIMLRAPLTLAAICLIAAAALATLDQTTREKIAAVRAQSQLSAFSILLTRQNEPNEAVEKLALATIHTRKNISDSETVKAIFVVPNTPEGSNLPKLYVLQLAGRGFGGPLEIFAAYRPDATLYHAIMLDNAETPGFGKKAEDPAYMQMFWDYGSMQNEKTIPTTKQALQSENASKIDAITGSTISFSAISTTLLAGADWLEDWSKQ